MRNNHCVFCKEMKGEPETNFARIYPEIKSRFVLTSSHFNIMPCVGQLNETHCLLIPKKHVCSFRQTDKKHFKEVTDLIESYLACYPSKQDLLIFEHGTTGPSDGGCGIYHAHLHLINVSHVFDPWQIYEFNADSRFGSLEESLYTKDVHDQPYVLVGTMSRGFKIQACDRSLPSQYLRRQVAHLLGIVEWDWRNYGQQSSFFNFLKRFDAFAMSQS